MTISSLFRFMFKKAGLFVGLVLVLAACSPRYNSVSYTHLTLPTTPYV